MKAVVPLLRELAQMGFHADKNRAHSLPDENSASFTLNLAKGAYKLGIVGSIALDRGLCKRVQTGAETREVPTYRIECPEGSDALKLEEE